MKKLLTLGTLGCFLGCGPGEGLPGAADDVSSQLQGVSTTQGSQPQGSQPQGSQPQGGNNWLPVERVELASATRDGYPISTVQLQGSKLVASAFVIATKRLENPPPPAVGGRQATTGVGVAAAGFGTVAPLPNIPTMNMVGTEWIGRSNQNLAFRLRIVGHIMDTWPGMNMMSRPEWRSNSTDVHFYQVQIDVGGVWRDLCSTQAGQPPNAAIFTKGYWLQDKGAMHYQNSAVVGISCWDGTLAKCVRWGLMPWKTLTPPAGGPAVSLQRYHEACVHAAMADYCGIGQSNTYGGTLVDVSDSQGFISPVSENSTEMFSDEAVFSDKGAVCLQRARYEELQPLCKTLRLQVYGTCPGALALVNNPGCQGGVADIEQKPFERGALASCAAPVERKLIRISSKEVCSHSPLLAGATLAIDCNWLTKAVCDGNGYGTCCQQSRSGNQNWTPACAARASQIYNSPVVVGGGGGVVRQ